jgi:anti-anti-sigma factor
VSVHEDHPIATIETVGTTVVTTLTVSVLAEHQGFDQLPSLMNHVIKIGAPHIVFDLQNVQEMDSATMSWIVKALNKMAESGTGVAISSPEFEVGRQFQTTKLERHFPICPDVMTALTAVERDERAA